MALFRQSKARASGGKGRSSAATAAPGKRRSGSLKGFKAKLRFLGWLVAGIALMAGVGYLVAAIWLFPSPFFPSERMVPRVVGLSEADATRQLEKKGFTVRAEAARHMVAARGTVTWQDPPPGMAMPKHAEIRLTISGGPPFAVIPPVDGLDLDMATRMIRAVGLHVETVDTVVVKSRFPGVAAGTLPAAGDSVPVGRGVTVHLVR